MQATERFDGPGLYAALDAERQERGLSWSALAAQIGVSATTLKGTRTSGALELDGVLAMLRWLGRSAESFSAANRHLAGSAMRGPTGRFRTGDLYAALDERRQASGLSWRAVAVECAVAAPQITGLAKVGRTSVGVALALTHWLGRDIESFAGL
jgi:uncharacterized protein YfiM (DUF2279 family)